MPCSALLCTALLCTALFVMYSIPSSYNAMTKDGNIYLFPKLLQSSIYVSICLCICLCTWSVCLVLRYPDNTGKDQSFKSVLPTSSFWGTLYMSDPSPRKNAACWLNETGHAARCFPSCRELFLRFSGREDRVACGCPLARRSRDSIEDKQCDTVLCQSIFVHTVHTMPIL